MPDMTNADKCDDAKNKCVSGTTGDSCGKEKEICKEGACAAKEWNGNEYDQSYRLILKEEITCHFQNLFILF